MRGRGVRRGFGRRAVGCLAMGGRGRASIGRVRGGGFVVDGCCEYLTSFVVVDGGAMAN